MKAFPEIGEIFSSLRFSISYLQERSFFDLAMLGVGGEECRVEGVVPFK